MLAELIQDLEQETLDNIEREERFLSSEVSWQQYEALLLKLENNSYYRVTYLDGVLEILSPSRRHEGAKKRIATLLEAYFEETDTNYFPLGSTTLRKQNRRGGTEPDESYCIDTEKEFPDLAVEVVFTSGGVDKLAVYKTLGVTEVWFWEKAHFSVYRLRGDNYEPIQSSELFPDLDLALLAEYMQHSQPLLAVKEFHRQIRREKDLVGLSLSVDQSSQRLQSVGLWVKIIKSDGIGWLNLLAGFKFNRLNLLKTSNWSIL